jgi:hypothetical protein
MYNSWKKDLAQSIKALESIRVSVMPKLLEGEIFSIENANNEILIMLDQISGVDMIRRNAIGLQGIAARVQYGRAWNSFTVREKRHTGAKTEMEKRLQQISGGYFYPAYTLQAYFDNPCDLNLLSIAVIDTVQLYWEIENNPNVKTRISDNVFKYINWDDITDKSKIKIIENNLENLLSA